MSKDTIVEEVHAHVRAHAEKFEYNLNAIYADLLQEEQSSIRRVVAFTPRPPVTVRAPSHIATAEEEVAPDAV